MEMISGEEDNLGIQVLRLGDNCQILAVRSDNCQIGQLSVAQLSADHGQLSVETVSALKKL